jgi:SAM-dependent methyltransferase
MLKPVLTGLPPVASSRRYGSSVGHPERSATGSKGRPKPGMAGPADWTYFWREFGVDDRPLERCYIPGDGQAVVDGYWAQFASALSHNAHVIDLGCGAGIAGRRLLKCRSDLQITGIDFAQVPNTTVANLTTHSWVRMEALPFGEAEFDAAISLFGIEYANIEETAHELRRVLRHGGRFSFLVHHHDSEIVREGRARLKGLRDVLAGPFKAAFLAGRLSEVEQLQQRQHIAYRGIPSIKTFGDHFRLNIARTRAERLAIWQKLADDLDPEIILTTHMERSAKSPEQLGSWLVPLLSTMRKVSAAVLRRGSGEPIAWEVSGIR